MSLKVSQRKLMAISIYAMITLGEFLYFLGLSSANRDLLLVRFSIIAIINLGIEIWMIKLVKGQLVSFFFFFIVFLYLFHFGQVIMSGLFSSYEYDYVNYIYHYMPDNSTLLQTLILSINVINLTFIGGLCAQGEGVKNRPFQNDLKKSDSVYMISKILIIVLLPFRLIIDIRQLVSAFIGGYYTSIKVSVSGVVDSLASIWYIMLIMLYVSAPKKQKKTIAVIALIYAAIKMLTGNRGHEMVMLISLFIVMFVQSEKQFSLKKIVLFCFAGYFALVFLDVIFEFRISGISYFISNWQEVISKSLRANILLETIGTFGETVLTPYLTIEQINQGGLHPFFGETFIKSVASIVPDVGGIFAEINNQAILGKVILTKHSIGGSYIAELYYNFGVLYGLAATVLGFVWGRLSNSISFVIKNNNYYKLMYILPFAVQLLWWTRDSVGNYTRNVIWQCLICCLLYSLLVRRKKANG